MTLKMLATHIAELPGRITIGLTTYCIDRAIKSMNLKMPVSRRACGLVKESWRPAFLRLLMPVIFPKTA